MRCTLRTLVIDDSSRRRVRVANEDERRANAARQPSMRERDTPAG